MRRFSRRVVLTTALVSLFVAATGLSAGRTVRAPLSCSRGGKGQAFRAVVTQPATQATGSRFTVRIDSLPSGKVKHFGLNYIFDMTTDYRIPAGTRFVSGSARLVPGTGTANARKGARVWHDSNGVHLLLPAHIENGGSYTPPSIEFELDVTAPPGTELKLKFARCRVSANVLLLGDVHTTCVPEPAPYTIGKTRAVSAGE